MTAREGSSQTALALVAGAVLILPLLLAPTPPLGDYPNHLARLWVLSHPDFWLLKSGVIEMNPHLTPNLGFELLALPLTRVLPFDAVGPTVVAITALAHLAGCLAVARVVTPKTWGYGALVGLFAYHTSLQAGFLSYSLAVALFLGAMAAWLGWMRGGQLSLMVLTLVLSIPLGLVHATGPALLGVSAGCILATQLARKRTTLAAVFRHGLVLVPSGVVFLLLSRPAPPGVGFPFGWNTFRGKINLLASWARTYDAVFDLLWFIAFVAAVYLVIRHAPKRRWDPDLLAGSLGLWLLAIAAPLYAMSGAGVDRRFVAPAFALLGLAMLPTLGVTTPRLLGLMMTVIVARQGGIAIHWRTYSRETVAVIAMLKELPAEAMLLQCSDYDFTGPRATKENMIFRHVGHYVTPLRGGVSSTLFGFSSQQPIIVDEAQLNRAANATSSGCAEPTWPYVLVEEGASTNTGQSYIRLAGTGRWSLWQRVERPTPSSPPS